MLCEYECGQEAKFQVTAKNKNCCSATHQQCPAVKNKNIKGLKEAYSSGRKGYTYNPNSAWSKGKSLIPNEEVFIDGSQHATEFVKKRILKDTIFEYKCACCNIYEWLGKEIVLELDHINGKSNDNRIENLRFLCPNCHSQTPTFRGRGIKGKKKVSDADLLTAYNNSSNIRQALIAVGLVPKGGNYTRMLKLIETSLSKT